MVTSDSPLSDFTAIDCSSILAGPAITQLLGDFGAEVIKVEHPVYGDAGRSLGAHDEPLTYKWVNRNKKSIGIDLHEEEGQEIVKSLVEEADIFVENFRPGTLDRWGLGWDTLSEVNPELVMVSVTGFGQTGPYRDRPGFGTLAESMSGFAYVSGHADGTPSLPSLGLADFICSLYSAYAVMIALHHRELHGGTGQYIDMSLLEPLFSLLGSHVVEYTMKGDVHEPTGNRTNTSAPRNTYKTKDGRWVALSGTTEKTAKRILRVVGGDELVNDERFRTMQDRINNVIELDAIIQDWMAERTREEVLEILVEHNSPVAPVNNIKEIVEDPHIQARGTMAELWDEEFEANFAMPGVIPKLSETAGSIRWTGPKLGEHTEEVLLEKTTLDEEAIRDLVERGILGAAD